MEAFQSGQRGPSAAWLGRPRVPAAPSVAPGGTAAGLEPEGTNRKGLGTKSLGAGAHKGAPRGCGGATLAAYRRNPGEVLSAPPCWLPRLTPGRFVELHPPHLNLQARLRVRNGKRSCCKLLILGNHRSIHWVKMTGSMQTLFAGSGNGGEMTKSWLKISRVGFRSRAHNPGKHPHTVQCRRASTPFPLTITPTPDTGRDSNFSTSGASAVPSCQTTVRQQGEPDHRLRPCVALVLRRLPGEGRALR